ncbi:MAG: hypothetical protein WC307_06600 [Candidatus Nanoarchaeia archaeon]|jgi:hypothetical protein
MKVRTSFVSNSSSTSFIITNLTSEPLTLLDFVKENPQVLEEFMIKCAEQRAQTLMPGDNTVEYGDEDGDKLGVVYDYGLRDGGSSARFKWEFLEYNR